MQEAFEECIARMVQHATQRPEDLCRWIARHLQQHFVVGEEVAAASGGGMPSPCRVLSATELPASTPLANGELPLAILFCWSLRYRAVHDPGGMNLAAAWHAECTHDLQVQSTTSKAGHSISAAAVWPCNALVLQVVHSMPLIMP